MHCYGRSALCGTRNVPAHLRRCCDNTRGFLALITCEPCINNPMPHGIAVVLNGRRNHCASPRAVLSQAPEEARSSSGSGCTDAANTHTPRTTTVLSGYRMIGVALLKDNEPISRASPGPGEWDVSHSGFRVHISRE